MAFSPLSAIGTGIKYFWRGLDAVRQFTFNLIFLFILIIFIVAMVAGASRNLDDKTALILDLKGALVEQHSGSVRDSLLAEAQGDAKKSTQLRDVLSALEHAGSDSKISSVVLLLDDLQSAGLSNLREVAAAIDRFKATGKKVVAWGTNYDQKQYFLAAHANEVYMHPMGTVLLTGFGRYRNYYHDALEKIGVTVNVLKVGTYKSFAEPYIANGPSPAAAEADRILYASLWQIYTDDVEKARKLPNGAIMDGIDHLPELLKAEQGDIAKMDLKLKLVDGLKTRDELRQLMLERGVKDSQTKSFRQIDLDDYLALQKPQLFGDAIAVVIAEGEISDGIAPPGAIGGLSTANLVRKAREDDKIKALVLRVDSPGGSVLGSELIRRELELTKKAGKPVVISMGDVAASGGYWISTSSDEVIADAATITGSIGVFAIFPTVDRVIDKLGVHTAGATTTWLSDAFNPLRPLDPRFGEVIQAGITHIYSDFTSKVAVARKTTPEKIDEVAQGRVWTGLQAKERGLVDKIGSFNDAIQSAAKRAKLNGDYRITYIEREPSGIDRVLSTFGGASAKVLKDQFKLALVPTGLSTGVTEEIGNELGWLADLQNDKKGYRAIAHCFCSKP